MRPRNAGAREGGHASEKIPQKNQLQKSHTMFSAAAARLPLATGAIAACGAYFRVQCCSSLVLFTLDVPPK